MERKKKKKWRHKDSPRESKASGVHCYWTCLIRNDKRNSSSLNERIPISHIKRYKNIRYTGEGDYI